MARNRTLLGIAAVLAVTWVAYSLRLNLAATGFLQLLIALAVALFAGFWQATLVSLIAAGCLNYFFAPPILSWGISDPQDWVALAAFEIAVLVVSRLSARAQQEARMAAAKQRQLEALYEVSRKVLVLDRKAAAGGQLVRIIQETFALEAVVLFDASTSELGLAGPAATPPIAEARAAYLMDRDSENAADYTWTRVLRSEARPMGGLALRGSGVTSLTASALASLAAITLERARSLERETHAEAERQTERLRGAVLDSLAHEFKTPLTTIRTAATGLMEMNKLDETQFQLMSLIDTEAEKLNGLTTRLLRTSRLDGSEIVVRREEVGVAGIIEDVLSEAAWQSPEHQIRLEGTGAPLKVFADRELLTMALSQFVDNAVKYSEPGSAITLRVEELPGEIRIGVHNMGVPIARENRERIFERFFRTPEGSRAAPGTGIGLSITKKIAQAHAGRVWVSSDAVNGNTFFLALPVSGQERL